MQMNFVYSGIDGMERHVAEPSRYRINMSLDQATDAWLRSLSAALEVTPSRAAADIIRLVRDISLRHPPTVTTTAATPEDEIRMMFDEYSTAPQQPRQSTEVTIPLP